jgi:hypothetical protein
VTICGGAEELEKLYAIMTELEWAVAPTIENGFGTTWLGCLVNALGEDWQQVKCRGEWNSLTRHKDTITFCAECAWVPCTEVFELIERKFPTLKVYYIAEEDGCLLYETNDAEGLYYPERYYVNLCAEQDEYRNEYFVTLEDALSWIRQMMKRPVNSEADVEQLNKELEETSEDAFCYLHKVEVV